jgi:sigma-54 dependent transcriptional regulator, acetoin dehydrogenase operon transcriptional activator AcoR
MDCRTHVADSPHGDDNMTDSQAAHLRVERARELFFAQKRDPGEWLSPHISRSWQRSAPADRSWADPAPIPLAMLRERRDRAMRLLECAQPELDSLAEHAIGNGCVVVLTDAHGLILEEIGSPEFLPKAERVALAPGVEWSELSRGTNAIGTALAEREALMVLGREHFLPENGALGCAAAPIFTARGDVAGVLDISGETVRVNQHALGLVRLAAQQVEHRMMLAEANGHLLRLHPRAGLLGTAREGLVMIDDGRIVGANRAALALLGATWGGLLGQQIAPLLGMSWAALEHRRGLVTLPGGLQVAAATERRVQASAGRGNATPAAAPESDRDDIAPLLSRAVRVLNAGVAVLVTGETGTGKEVFARRLHRASRRAGGPLIAVNCAALPETLIEAELFGYDDGAFTGARRRGMPGRIREAHGGVLFLDEIADMPLALQTRLLRVLEEREVTPLGGGAAVKVDFDLVCATHEDLAALAAARRFRSDLLYRVMGYGVSLPALRDRSDRRALIATLFAECAAPARALRLAPDALDTLAAYPWPGNLRELRSALQSIAALAEPGQTITADRLPGHFVARAAADASTGERPPAAGEPSSAAEEALAAIESNAIERALEASGQNVSEAARRLGVHRSTVYRHRSAKRTQGAQ